MRTNSSRALWLGLLLHLLLPTVGCSPLTTFVGRSAESYDSARNDAVLFPEGGPRAVAPRVADFPGPTSRAVQAGPGRDHRLDASHPGRENIATQLALLRSVEEMSSATRRMSVELSRLKSSRSGIGGRHPDLFLPFVDQGIEQLRWMRTELTAANRLSNTASEVDVPDMQLALLRFGGSRLQAVLLGSFLLDVRIDFLHLADVVLREYPSYNVEELFRRMCRMQDLMAPSSTALSSLEPSRLESAATDLPALVSHLTSEFVSIRDAVHASAVLVEKVQRTKDLIEMLTLVSAMKMSLPRLPPAAPAALGLGLVVRADGVMMGTRLVVSAEWVDRMQRLVRAGILSLPVAGAAVRIHAGQVMMARSDELPRSVSEALGDGPEVRGMRVTSRTGAGMAEPPRHHVLPREFREWFEARGFTGEMSVDQFCVRMDQARHEAIHGGGDWRLGRTWPGEWNRMIMKALRGAEADAGRMLTRSEILQLVAKRMTDYNIPLDFTPWGGR